MSPIYANTVGRERFESLLKRMRYLSCAECGADLMLSHEGNVSTIVCTRNDKHDGIVREQSPYEKDGDMSLNITTRRDKMVEKIGEEKTRALAKFEGVTSLTKQDANEILTTIYPTAPKTEIQRAMLLCASYSLNPLMGHVFLIPFKGKDGKPTFATVMGIKATRLMASRRGAYSYMDDTPRLMTEEEQVKIYGEVQKGDICAITRLKDPATGAEVSGYGKWRKGDTVYGTDKGNSAINMAFIRSERQALDRLRPGEMPMNVDVVDDRFIPKDEAPEAPKSQATKDVETLWPEDDKEPDVVEGEAHVVEDEEPQADPSKYTAAELLSIAKENGWSLTDIGKYANSGDRGAIGGWGIKDLKDLDKLEPEKIGELIDVITKNPKSK